MNPVVKYSLARLVLFVATLALLAWAGMGQLWAIIAAAVISMLLSYVLLRPLRDQVTERLAARTQRRLERHPQVGVDEQAEDAVVDALDASRAAQAKPQAE